MGPGIAGILTFLFAKPGYMPSTAVIFYGQSPVQIPVGNYEITLADLGMETNALRYHGNERTMLSSKHGT